MSTSEPVASNEEENVEAAVPENKLMLDNIAEWFQLFKAAFSDLLHHGFFYNTVRALKLKQWEKDCYRIEIFLEKLKSKNVRLKL